MIRLNSPPLCKRVINLANGLQRTSYSIDSLIPGGEASTRLAGVDKVKPKISDTGRREAQAALLDYFYLTRSLRFSDAENMSYNAPNFLNQLLDKVEVDEEAVGRSVTRFLRFHPVNEFEPFFESLGLQPSVISRLLPSNLVFLFDDNSLLVNYYALCDFGIPRDKLGKIYENSRELFYCDTEVLVSKLLLCSNLGFSRSFVALFFSCTPNSLSEKVLEDSIEVLNIIKRAGIEISRVEKHLESCIEFKWSTMLSVLKLLMANGYTDEQLNWLIREHPDVLFFYCGHTTFAMISFLFKLGFSLPKICDLFQQFSKIHVEVFFHNLRTWFHLFNEIQMEMDSIGRFFRSHVILLGSCTAKRTNTLLNGLNVGKERLCQIIMGDPHILKEWALGSRVKRFSTISEKQRSKFLKKKFLLDVGFEENSEKMNMALKHCRGKSSDLQRRFDFLVEAGLSREDVSSIIMDTPQILNQKSDVLERKIKFFVEDLKHPISELVNFPYYLWFAPERVKLRLSMYNFLKDRNGGKRELSFRTLMSRSDKYFIGRYVLEHPGGLEIYENLKKQIFP